MKSRTIATCSVAALSLAAVPLAQASSPPRDATFEHHVDRSYDGKQPRLVEHSPDRVHLDRSIDVRDR
jgi:hypothetical protein